MFMEEEQEEQEETLLIFGISVSFLVFAIELICRLYTFNSSR
jgi:hypothetical protein